MTKTTPIQFVSKSPEAIRREISHWLINMPKSRTPSSPLSLDKHLCLCLAR